MHNCDQVISRTLAKYIDWILYRGTAKPSDDMSNARWQAVVKHILREYINAYLRCS